MHECPRCGQWCDCSGDIDDIPVMTEDWAYVHCEENHDIGGGGCIDDEDPEDN